MSDKIAQPTSVDTSETAKRRRGRPKLELSQEEIDKRKRHRLDYLNDRQKAKYRRHMDSYAQLLIEVENLREEVRRLRNAEAAL